MNEQLLRAHRDQAIKLLQENRLQSREGIEMLVKGRLARIASTTHSDGGSLSEEQVASLYNEVLDLAYVMFSLGYSMAHSVNKAPAKSR